MSLEDLEGFQGLIVEARVYPEEAQGYGGALGGVGVEPTADPYSATKVMAPFFDGTDTYDEHQLAAFASGTYRFIIQAYVPNGPMRYGCETQIRVDGDEPVFVRISSMPVYRGSGYDWIPVDELQYPRCFGTVKVVVRGLEGERGNELAGVLRRLDPPQPADEALGGFSVEIDSDPFSTTQVVRRGEQGWPDPDLGLPFPFVEDEIATIQPGTYKLELYTARELVPYSRWMPGGGEGLKGCQTTFLVGEGEDARVRVTDPILVRPPWELPDCEG